MSVFSREISKTLGLLPIDINVGSKTSLSAFFFFVINSTANYNVFLGIDWIHTKWCVLSSFHQFSLFWKDDEVKVIWVSKQPFIATLYSIEASYYDQEFGPIKFKRQEEGWCFKENIHRVKRCW